MENWTTKEGRSIPIADLSDQHLLNILKMLRRSAVYRAAKETVSLINCARPHGDAANDAFNAELERACGNSWNAFVGEEFDSIRSEGSRRFSIQEEVAAICADEMMHLRVAVEMAILKESRSIPEHLERELAEIAACSGRRDEYGSVE